MAYLTCEDLVIGFPGQLVAEGISFSVGAGDLLCVIGQNGAGKSTLVRTLLGLIPPLGGSLEFGDGLVAGEVGYLPQQGETQRDFPATAWEIALSGCVARLGRRPFFGGAERALAERSLTRVGALELRDRSFAELSGGQRQRVLIARALCAASRLLVLDEPMTGLDPQASADLYGTIEALRADGMGVIAVSHDVEIALSHASHVLAFGDGAPFFGTAAQWHARMDRHDWAHGHAHYHGTGSAYRCAECDELEKGERA